MENTHMSTVEVSRPSPERVLSIERRNAKDLLYEVFLKEYVSRNLPVVIENSVREWPALRTWTPQYFKQRFGAKMVDVTYGVRRPMGEVMDEIVASTAEHPGPYLHKVMIYQHMPELLAELSPANLYGFPRRYSSPLMPPRFRHPDGYLKLIIGGVGGKFPLMHFDSDNANAMITEIYGDKEFVLFSPKDTPYLYPHKPGANTTQIENVESPDLERFPLFVQAAQYRGTIHPGDSIFVPSGWWHTTRVVTTSISVCVNMLHAANWSGFIAESCRERNGSAIARMAKRVYLKLAGAVMTLAEAIQEKHPGSMLARRVKPLCPNPVGHG